MIKIQSVLLLLILILFTACSAPNNYTLDSSRQVAVDKVMTDDIYTENDGYDLREVEAKILDCENCFAFKYEFLTSRDYSNVDYSVDIIVQNGQITSILFTPKAQSLPPIIDRFDYTCENKCGDGLCDDIVCQSANCTCEETRDNCPEDC
ncbi:MAG: hypothetical protein ACP5NV_06525 [Candidatus Woesearchaeota archaeon]